MVARRTVTAKLELELSGVSDFVLAVALAHPVSLQSEELSVLADGVRLAPSEIPDAHGTRLHSFSASSARLSVEYRATALGRVEPLPVTPLDQIVYTRPSRYAQSDELTDLAKSEFAGLGGGALATAVGSWVHERLDYVPGASDPTDGATATLDTGAGVCRDFTHLSVALLRALDVPARLVAVYAPGLAPMDFHAVTEVAVDGVWRVIDSTRLAPRRSLIRIATGRDAADTAFLTNSLANIELLEMEVTATADELPWEDPEELVSIG